MRKLRQRQTNFWKEVERLSRLSSLFDPEIENRARSIIEAVRQRGDRALLEFTLKFDGARLTRPLLRVTPGELNQAAKMASPELRGAVRHAQKNIKDFSSHSLRADWWGENQEGGRVGEKFDPFGRVGIYIPGGTAPLVSTCWNKNWFNKATLSRRSSPFTSRPNSMAIAFIN